MARRKQELADKLGGDGQVPRRPGWRDTITLGRGAPEAPAPDPEPDPEATPRRRSRRRYKRKTYLISPEMIAHIEEVADQERVGINELVRFLLGTALDMVEDGQLEIPTRPARRRISPP
jgi:hypothetical protein